jgi:hypothetical protein
MSDDNPPNFIDRSAQIFKNWTGEAHGPEKILEEFHLYGHAKRATALDEFDDHLRTADTSNLRKFSDLHNLRSKMDKVHHALRKVGR